MEDLRSGDPHWIGEYRLLRRLGTGGMGNVYLARSRRGRTVAVKLVQSALADQEEFRRRFRHEVEAARRVGGAWTAPVLDADTEATTPWVATGYVAGPSLHQVVTEQGPLPDASVHALADGLVRALGDIHGAGLVHRDLKPSNILVTIDGPRVIDFGIARTFQTVADSMMTRTGSVIGSPGFMSPEQVRGEKVSPASDVFCLGAVLAYATTGRAPFGGSDTGMHSVMFRIAHEQPDLEGIPPGPLRELIMDCLAKDPGLRPTLDSLASRTAPYGPRGAAWLPEELTAQLGRHAVQLLDTEAPSALTTEVTAARPPCGVEQPIPTAPSAPYSVSARPSPTHALTPGEFGPPPSVLPPAPSPEQPPAGTSAGIRILTAPRRWANALVALLCTVTFVWALELNMLSTIDGALASAETSADLGRLRDEYTPGEDLLLAVQAATMTLTAGVWLAWFRRIRLNAEVFAPQGHRHSRIWAVLGWFVPVAHLWIPQQVMRDAWSASTLPGRRRPRAAGLVFHVWWLAWTVQLSGLYLSAVSKSWDDADTVAEARSAVRWTSVTDGASLLSGVLAVLVVQALTTLQAQRIASTEGLAFDPRLSRIGLSGPAGGGAHRRIRGGKQRL
ncbi:DUF4328 domain-containing protein [Streptomyces sp. NPDC047023]|uniref:protein kinase domain-containing protein n=1 Tax=Streptomyces sp. NPDC047023 TaxID=3155139 RepID=UPI003406F8C5